MTMNSQSASANTGRRRGRWALGRSALIGGVIAALSWVGAAQAATELFLKWPGIPGDSVVLGHRGEITLNSYSQSASNNDTVVPLAIRRSVCGQIVVSKLLDQSSPHFLGLVLEGKVTAGPVVVTFAKSAPAAGPQTYYTVTLNNVLVTSVSQNDSAGDIVSETITLLAGRFSYSVLPQKTDGTAGVPVTFGWDCAANRAL
jgi:type VI protein secretion system component Hcp